jgi:hypothetical protein
MVDSRIYTTTQAGFGVASNFGSHKCSESGQRHETKCAGHHVRRVALAHVSASDVDTKRENLHELSVLKLDVLFSFDLASAWPIGHSDEKS